MATKQYPGTVPDKLQPHDIEAEEAVLGSLLIDADAIIRIAPLLEPGDFFIERHGWIYEAIREMYARNTPADIVTLTDEMDKRGELDDCGGPAAITRFINSTPSSIWVDHYAGIVAEKATRRRLLNAAGDIARLAYQGDQEVDDVINRAEEIMFGVTSERGQGAGPRHIKEAAHAHMDRTEYLWQNKGNLAGMPTGLIDLDRLLGGLQRSDMIVLAGRPGMGKTSMALSIALHNAQAFGKRVAVFSLEMSDQQLISRLASAESSIDSQRLRTGRLHDGEWSKYQAAMDSIIQMPLYIDDAPAITPFYLRSRARRLQAQFGLDLLIVDYMQLMQSGKRSENRQQEITFISASLKALARELNIPVLALSQLSRACESRADKRPMLSDLRESGSIEQDADVVMFVYRDEVYDPDTIYPNLAEIIVSKHRSGPTGTFKVYFKKHLTQFVDLDVNVTQLNPMPERNGRHA